MSWNLTGALLAALAAALLYAGFVLTSKLVSLPWRILRVSNTSLRGFLISLASSVWIHVRLHQLHVG